jgi:hypothetical protein
MSEIRFATVLFGATGFKDGNVNDTFRGQVVLEDRSIRQAILKDLDTTQLGNELLAYALARHVGLPIPDCYIGLVRPGVLPVTKGPTLQDGSRLVFVSADVKVPNVTFQLTATDLTGKIALLADISKWADLGRLYAFDAWIANIDRHCGNLLFGNPGDAWIIDHGHSFTGATWKPHDLDPLKEFANRLSEWMTPMLSTDQRTTRKSEAAAMEATLKGFDATATSESSRISELLSLERVTALKAFLEGRADKVTFHASKALGVPVMV